MVKVYRYENEKGQGPYKSKWRNEDVYSQVHGSGPRDKKRHPSPSESGLDVSRTRNQVFAFHSPKQAHAWYNEGERAKLGEMGFKMNTYDVPKSEVTRGRKQVTFTPQSAKKLDD